MSAAEKGVHPINLDERGWGMKQKSKGVYEIVWGPGLLPEICLFAPGQQPPQLGRARVRSPSQALSRVLHTGYGMTSNSYSALIRRSKLSTYNPKIDQVYSSHHGFKARNDFGLKRPIQVKGATSSTTPMIRLTALDTPQRTTHYRKATKEHTFTNKWNQLGLNVQVNTPHPGASSSAVMVDRTTLQSRFVPADLARQYNNHGTIIGLDQLSRPSSSTMRVPNFFAMEQDEFDRFIDELGDKKEAFTAFVAQEQAKIAGSSSSGARVDPPSVDLYEHAQSQPSHLSRLLERFLALSTTVDPSAAPVPHPHPMLAIQYSNPTALESALSPPVPGRLLGPSPTFQHSASKGGTFRDNRDQLYASIIGQVAPLGLQQTNGASSTTFFPDAQNQRSNQPGRVSFRLRASISPAPFASKQALSARRGQKPYRPDVPAHEPQALAARAIELHPAVITAQSLRALPGSQAYSGDLPPAPKRSGGGYGSASRGGAGGSVTDTLSELMLRGGPGGPGGSFSPRTSWAGRQMQQGPRTDRYPNQFRRSKAENTAYKLRGQALMEERQATDGKVFGSGGGKGANKSGGKRGDKNALISQLNRLLEE